MEPQNTEPAQNGPKQNDIAKKAAQQRQPVFDPTGRIEALMDNETLLFDVRRHIIGLVFIYIQIIFAMVLSMVLVILFLPTIGDVFGIDSNTANSLAAALALFLVAFGLIFLVLAHRIYRGNQLIASDKNITQVAQIGLFNRKISELSMSSIEDVTARQPGILPTIFNYGSLHIETAGEQNNFIFAYCPNPNAYAKAILDARTNFIAGNGAHH